MFNDIAKSHLKLVCSKEFDAVTIYYELIRDRWYYAGVDISQQFKLKICPVLAPFCLIVSKP